MALSLKSVGTVCTAPRAHRAAPVRTTVVPQAVRVDWQAAAAAFIASSALMAQNVQAITYDQLQSLSYKEVKGTGLANMCPTLESGNGDMIPGRTNPVPHVHDQVQSLKPGQYRLERFCMEPTSFQVKEPSIRKGDDSAFVDTTLLTRMTYTLDQMEGNVTVGPDGKLQLKELDGFDYAPVTVRLPGGETVPFLFSIKELNAKGPADSLIGSFTVPSYRGSTFMDPKGRGASAGYESAIALQTAQDADDILKENLKSIQPSVGTAVLSVARMDPETGEVAGVFETIQPSDTDMGAKQAKDIKVTGLWYGQLVL